jgi:predicted DNA-binding transcriptional regulator AlpA|tara:strand:+ start:506 stop:709 length:204 start_codon:yes stop_codon:yes gene_type:complete
METGVTGMNNDFINQKEVAEMLSIRPRTINKMIKTDETFPKPLVISQRIKRWRREDILGWIKNKMPN